MQLRGFVDFIDIILSTRCGRLAWCSRGPRLLEWAIVCDDGFVSVSQCMLLGCARDLARVSF